jgi:hypothetical protein
MIAVSVPEMDTGTQVDRAVDNIIGTKIIRDRRTRAEMEAENLNVSENVKIN